MEGILPTIPFPLREAKGNKFNRLFFEFILLVYCQATHFPLILIASVPSRAKIQYSPAKCFLLCLVSLSQDIKTAVHRLQYLKNIH